MPDEKSPISFARHAASLIVLRDGASGPEVLMGVRGAGHRFMPNCLVFPGGAVDSADADAKTASEPAPHTLAMLGRKAKPRLARAIVVAAARELEEETGLSLGRPPRLCGVHYLCRAVTPTTSPIRFNARFLIVAAEETEGTPGDTGELQSVGYRPLEAVKGDDLMLVTREVLQRLAAWLALPSDARLARPSLDVFKQRRWRTE